WAVARLLWQRGYGFDYVSDRLLRTNISTYGYRAIVVPPTQHMPDETFGRLLDLARAGATVVFLDQLPSDVPGWDRLPERRGRLEDAKRRLALGVADGNGMRRSVVGKGRVLGGQDVGRLLDAAGVRGGGTVATGGGAGGVAGELVGDLSGRRTGAARPVPHRYPRLLDGARR